MKGKSCVRRGWLCHGPLHYVKWDMGTIFWRATSWVMDVSNAADP